MTSKPNLTRCAALLTALGLGLSPALATSVVARGGPDPWKPNKKKPKSHVRTKPGSPRQR